MLLKHILLETTCRNCLLATILVAATVTSCTTPTQNSGIINSGTQVQLEDTLENLMLAAKQAGSNEQGLRESQLLNIAQRLFKIGELSSATNIIASIVHDALDDQQYVTYTLTASDIFLASQALYKAKTLLSSPRLESMLEQFSIEQQRHLHKNKAALYVRTGEVVAGLNEHIALGTLLSSTEDINLNNNTIWKQLSELTYEELNTLNSNTADAILTGWLELAATSKLSQSSLQSQSAATLNWIAAHPNHPASQQLPADLALLQQLIDERPNNIAILLPLQGKLSKAGQAIRDGFLAAYFYNQKTEQDSPAVVFYDTSEADIHTLYDQAVANGAEIIIGPLSKKKVSKLQSKPSISVPVLALNYIEQNDLIAPPLTNKPFYQFGLSLEDEAIQVADRAWLEGHRQALVLSSNAKWSQRASDAFISRWTEKGGVIVADSHLDKAENYSSTIGSILDIDKSQKRATELKRLFGRGFEFEPRRRSDIDMIFLVARSQEGRQIKPTLNFHYASNIPVYATSQIYSSANSNEKNSDLNNIHLTTLPWVLNKDIPEKTLITDNITISPAYERLYALGVDSFLLYPRLEQLYQFNDQQLYGTTGQLSINHDKRVSRKQLWAKISRGQLKRLRALTLSNDNTL